MSEEIMVVPEVDLSKPPAEGKKAEGPAENKGGGAFAPLKKARVEAGRKALNKIWQEYEGAAHDEEQVHRWSQKLKIMVPNTRRSTAGPEV